MSPQVVVVADDLSGGNSVGLEFSGLGFKTCLSQQMPDRERTIEADVIVYNTDTRLSTPAEAYRKLYEMGSDSGAAVIIKKIDSLLRGNVGVEIGAIMDRQKHAHVLVLPASPGAGRKTVGGNQLVHGTLLTDQQSTDPSISVTDSHIPTLLAKDMGKPVGLLPVDIIVKGRQAIREALERLMLTYAVIVADGTKQDHLNEVTAAAYEQGIRFFAGTFGIGEAVGRILNVRRTVTRPVLTIVGSLSDISRRQVMAVHNDHNIKVIPIMLPVEVNHIEPDETAAKYAGEMNAAIGEGYDVLLYTAFNKEHIERVQEYIRRSGVSVKEVEQNISRLLQKLTGPVLPKVSGLVLTGGATAQAIFQLVQSSGLNILSYEVVTGVPAAKIIDGPYRELLFLTKPGAYGEDSALQQMISYVRLQRRLS